MTALDLYAKLEAEARYFDRAGDDGRDAILSFGARSLIIMALDDSVIGHWPLAGLRGQRGEDGAVRLSPGGVRDEWVALSDPAMLDAIFQVCPDLYRDPAQEEPATRRRPRLRRLLVWMAVAAVAGSVAGMLALGGERATLGLLTREKARMLDTVLLPGVAAGLAPQQRQDTAVRRCIARDGVEALATLARRLWPDGNAPPLLVVRGQGPAIVTLPGGTVVMTAGLIDAAPAPERVAGWIAHAAAHAGTQDPARRLVRAMDLRFAMALLLDGLAEPGFVAEAAAVLLSEPHLPEAELRADDTAAALLTAAGLPTGWVGDPAAPLKSAGALSLLHPDDGTRIDRLAASDRVGSAPFQPALGDRDWLALRAICDRTAPIRP